MAFQGRRRKEHRPGHAFGAQAEHRPEKAHFGTHIETVAGQKQGATNKEKGFVQIYRKLQLSQNLDS